MIDFVFKDGTVITGRVLVKTLFCAVIKTTEGKFFLVSKFALKDPDQIKFRSDS